MTEHQAVYPVMDIDSHDAPVPPCSVCRGAMLPDIVLGDFHQCSVCGCRRMVPKVAAASGRDDIRALFEELLADLQSTWLASCGVCDSDREIIQDDIDDYRARLAALLGRV